MFLILAKLTISQTYVFIVTLLVKYIFLHLVRVAYKSVKMHLTFIVCRSTMQGTEFISSWIWFSPGFDPRSDLALAATAHKPGSISDFSAAVWRQHGGSSDF